jgi:FKBP-type peptidyl-prolyl cis-trans isomerase SlyD
LKIGDETTVTFDYILKEDGGKLLEDTASVGPVTYLHGQKQMLPKLEEALTGAEAGQSLSVLLTPDEAYGHRDESLVIRAPESEFEEPQTLRVGEEIHLEDDHGRGILMTVTGLEEGTVVLDGNHPFAGLHLNFAVTIRTVRATTPEDIQNLEPSCGCGEEDCGHDHSAACGEEGCEGCGS